MAAITFAFRIATDSVCIGPRPRLTDNSRCVSQSLGDKNMFHGLKRGLCCYEQRRRRSPAIA